MDTKNYSDVDCRSDVPQDQSYMNMSDPAGQDQVVAGEDMVKAMLTPGGLYKKVADSTYDTDEATETGDNDNE